MKSRMRRCAARLSAVLAIVAGSAGPARSQQVLRLSDALARAETHAYGNRIAAGQAATQSAQATAALRGILPTVRMEGGWVRTTDPIGAFGTALRQRRIAAPDFDPARLNYPAATTNYAGAVVVEQPVLNADAHLGRRAAAHAGEAAEAGAGWTRVNTRVDAIRAYYGAVLAAEKAVTLAVADSAARQHVAQSESAVRAGVATRSDALLARVRAGEVETQLLEARGDAALARRQLAVVLGVPADTSLVLPARLPGPEQVRALLLQDRVEPMPAARADVRAAQLGVKAAQFDVMRARALLAPRINAFGRYDWNSPTSPYGGDENWTVGVIATWTPFAGASEWAERQAASGRAAAARAALAAAEAQAALEMERAENARVVALARLDIAQRSAHQSVEAHRIVTKKYEGGLATVAELLEAAAVEMQSALSLTHARWIAIVAAAELRRTLGHDPATIAAFLDTANAGETE